MGTTHRALCAFKRRVRSSVCLIVPYPIQTGRLYVSTDRRLPGTGELNYRNILRKARSIGYSGYVECEFVAHDDPEGGIETVAALLGDGR